ncbi:MAG: UDP-N-acetylmuramate dehydrogenase [Clostridia bacterium]|nr:UDP-N-acetylmuramate dehydrogenase [Clostridia bacterium]
MISLTETFVCTFSEKYPECVIEENYDLAAHTTMRVGGKAAVAVFPETAEQLCAAVEICAFRGIRHAVLGHASNVVCSDEGYDGVIIRTEKLCGISVYEDEIVAECGASLNALARAALNAGLTGAEFLYGIPGSVGGACYMNAGAYGGQISDVLLSVTAYNSVTNTVKEYAAEECNFGYRQSIFHDNDSLTVLSCRLRLCKGDREAIGAKMDELISARKEKQPLEYPSAGSFFKRCEGHFTAKLIDDCGLKGTRVGGAMISEKHAGFLINYDNASCADVMALSELVRSVVKEKYGLDIEREVEYLE